MYWAKALAGQDKDAALKAQFESVAEAMQSNEATIVEELNSVQGPAMDIGGYYKPDPVTQIGAGWSPFKKSKNCTDAVCCVMYCF